jgi:hypothetical protein
MQTWQISKCTASACTPDVPLLPLVLKLLCTVLQLHRLLQLDRHAKCRLAAAIRKDAKLQHIAGLFADMETLLALRELGMPLSDDVVRAVAQSGRLDILQHLIREQQCPTPQALSHWAAHSGNIDMLEWLRAEGLCEFDHNMCAGAAEGRHLAVLQHLRSLWLGRVVHCLFCGERWQHRSGRVAAAAGRRTVWS